MKFSNVFTRTYPRCNNETRSPPYIHVHRRVNTLEKYFCRHVGSIMDGGARVWKVRRGKQKWWRRPWLLSVVVLKKSVGGVGRRRGAAGGHVRGVAVTRRIGVFIETAFTPDLNNPRSGKSSLQPILASCRLIVQRGSRQQFLHW